MQSLSSADEQSLLEGVKKAVDLVDNRGLSPNEAIQQVAEELNYSPGFAKAACNAFNNGRQLAQWNANDTVLDKLAGFPLADYEAVHEALWGNSQEKVAACVPFGKPQFVSYDEQIRQELRNADISAFTKSASEAEVDPDLADYRQAANVKSAYNRVKWEQRQVEESRRLKVASEDRLNLNVHLLESYFRKFAYDRLPLAQVEYSASAYYGKPGKALMDYVATRFPSEKRADDHQSSWVGFHQPVDRSAEPYTLIAACIKQAQVHNQMSARLAEAEEKLAAVEEAYQSFIQPHATAQNSSQLTLTPSLLPDEMGQKQASSTSAKSNDKQASILSGLAGGAGMGLTRNVADSITGPDDSSQKMERQINELESPEHQNELRKIRAQTVLTQLMSDPEGPLSRYDPEEVLQAYNEMVQLSPRLADQPAALGPLLNKQLMGATEPFEVGEQVKLEKGLKDVQAPQSTVGKGLPTSKSTSSSRQVDLMKNEASILS
jgi:hypothetical protein